MTRFTNLIAGRSAPSKAGLFALTARGPGGKSKYQGAGGELGQWPRSGAHAVAAAIEGLATSPPRAQLADLDQLDAGWRELLRMAGGAQGAGPADSAAAPGGFEAGLELLPARLGCSRKAAHELLLMGRYSSFGFGARDLGNGVPVALFCHWSDPLDALFAVVAECLFQGRPVLLLPDPDLPMAGAAIAQALLAVGLDGTGLAVLHALDTEGWIALAAATGHEQSLHATGRISVDQKLELTPFGQHNADLLELINGLATPREAEWIAPAALLESPCDPARVRLAAAALARAAFGAGHGFGGVAHGAPLLACIPRAAFSAFTAALVVELDTLATTANPPLAFLGSSGRHSVRARYDELWKAGLDEGATLITGGAATVHSPGGVHLHPGLLVNIDGDSGLFDLGEPLGVLRLQRA